MIASFFHSNTQRRKAVDTLREVEHGTLIAILVLVLEKIKVRE